jgi:hypothetical protein
MHIRHHLKPKIMTISVLPLTLWEWRKWIKLLHSLNSSWKNMIQMQREVHKHAELLIGYSLLWSPLSREQGG